LIALSIDRIRSQIDWRLAAAAASAGMAVAGYSVIDAYGTRLNGDWIGFTRVDHGVTGDSHPSTSGCSGEAPIDLGAMRSIDNAINPPDTK